jgi:hypothetical protein
MTPKSFYSLENGLIFHYDKYHTARIEDQVYILLVLGKSEYFVSQYIETYDFLKLIYKQKFLL